MLAPYDRWTWLLVGVLVPMHHRLAAQDKPKPGRAVTAWQVEHTTPFGNPGEVSESRDIYARNDTTVPIAVTVVRLSKCVNLRVSCGSAPINPIVLAPGGSRSVLRIVPALPAGAYSFGFTLGWRAATECIGVTANSPLDTVSRETTPAEIDKINTPPPPHFSDNAPAMTATVTFFVNASGAPDSVTATGITDPHYLKAFQAAMMKYHFVAATRNGCPVAATTTHALTLKLKL